MYLKGVSWAGLVVAQAEPAIFDNQVGAGGEGNGSGMVYIVHLDPQDGEISDILHWTFQLNGPTNVDYFLLRDVGNGGKSLPRH